MHECMHSLLSLPDPTHLICRSKLRLLHMQRRSASRVSPPSLQATNIVYFIGAILSLPHSAIFMCMRRSQATLLKAPSGASLQISARVDTVQQQRACKQADLTMLRLPPHSYDSAPPAEDTLWRQQMPKRPSQQQSLPYRRYPCGKGDRQPVLKVPSQARKQLQMLQLPAELSLVHEPTAGPRLQSSLVLTMKAI